MFERIVSFQARYRPSAIAIATPLGNATFAALDSDVDRMAFALLPVVPSLGHVTVQAAGGLHLVLILALARLGCISSSLAPIGERPESELLGLLKPDLYISDGKFDSTETASLLITPSWIADALSKPSVPVAPHNFCGDDPVRIILSSGTTGAPKKMILTRDMVDARVRTGGLSQMGHRSVHSAVGLDSETGFRAPFVAWATGSAAIYPEPGFAWADFLTKMQPGVIVLVPAQLNAILASLPETFPPQPGLRIIVISGTPSSTLYNLTAKRLSPEIYVTYGSTEAGLACQVSPDMMRHDDGLTGIISPSADLEIVDDFDQPVQPGKVGAIRVRTSEMVTGYSDDDMLTSQYFRHGWFYPGDIGSIDDKGSLKLEGRKTEIIDLDGLRISPLAIERVTSSIEGVRDVAAFGITIEKDARRAAVAVVCEDQCDLNLLKRDLRSALPQIDALILRVSYIPRSARGKVELGMLRRMVGLPSE